MGSFVRLDSEGWDAGARGGWDGYASGFGGVRGADIEGRISCIRSIGPLNRTPFLFVAFFILILLRSRLKFSTRASR